MNGYENGELVPVEASAEDLAAAEEEIEPEVAHLAQQVAYRMCADMLRRALMYVVDDPAPKLAADVIGAAFGLRLRAGITDTELASKHGISKEAFDQRKKRFLKMLGLKRVIVRGSKRRREKYRDANFRNFKHGLV